MKFPDSLTHLQEIDVRSVDAVSDLFDVITRLSAGRDS